MIVRRKIQIWSFEKTDQLHLEENWVKSVIEPRQVGSHFWYCHCMGEKRRITTWISKVHKICVKDLCKSPQDLCQYMRSTDGQKLVVLNNSTKITYELLIWFVLLFFSWFSSRPKKFTLFLIILSFSLPMSNRMRKKMQKKTSYQKTKEEFEAVIEKRRKKKEVGFFFLLLLIVSCHLLPISDSIFHACCFGLSLHRWVILFLFLQEYLKSKQQREEAIRRYKQKKTETFQMLSKKTKKGQPNLNLQMEFLLQRIQGAGK